MATAIGQYFDDTDYEILSNVNAARTDTTADIRRKVVREKLMAVHNKLESPLRALKLFSHWLVEHKTSLVVPCAFNFGKVEWLGVRFGKSQKEVYPCGNKSKESPFEGFQKHGCLQFALYGESHIDEAPSFNVSLFLAVPNNAVDRDYWKRSSRAIADINNFVANNKGKGYFWELHEIPSNTLKRFYFDTTVGKLTDFLMKNDNDGCFSSLRIRYAINDANLKTLQDVERTVSRDFKILLPLYNTMVWRTI